MPTPSTRQRYTLGELRPEHVVAIIDTREQIPLDVSPLGTEVGTLATGDYSVKGLENVVAVERKSLTDLLGCIGTERERFEREIQRMLAYPTRAVIVESTWFEVEAGGWRSKVTPAAAIGSLLGWIASGVPIILAGDHERAGRYVSRLLFTAARRRWREARGWWPRSRIRRTFAAYFARYRNPGKSVIFRSDLTTPGTPEKLPYFRRHRSDSKPLAQQSEIPRSLVQSGQRATLPAVGLPSLPVRVSCCGISATDSCSARYFATVLLSTPMRLVFRLASPAATRSSRRTTRLPTSCR